MPDERDPLLEAEPQTDSAFGTPPYPAVTQNSQLESKSPQMAEIQHKAKKFSWTLFALILICFFLPFFEVSCQGNSIISVNGMQMAFGTEIQQPTMFGPPQIQKIPGDGLVLLTLLVAAAGLGLSFIKGKLGSLLPAISGAIGFILMLIVKLRIDNDVLKQGGGMLTVEYALGFIAVCLLFLISAAANGFLYHLEKTTKNSR